MSKNQEFSVASRVREFLAERGPGYTFTIPEIAASLRVKREPVSAEIVRLAREEVITRGGTDIHRVRTYMVAEPARLEETGTNHRYERNPVFVEFSVSDSVISLKIEALNDSPLSSSLVKRITQVLDEIK